MVDHPLGDPVGLEGVVAGGAAPVLAGDVEHLYSDVRAVAVRAGVGDEFALVELLVRERDQGLVAGAVVPAQAQIAEGPGGPASSRMDWKSLTSVSGSSSWSVMRSKKEVGGNCLSSPR